MKKALFSLFMLVGLLVFTPTLVGAQDIFNEGCAGVTDSTLCEEVKNPENPVSGPTGILNKVINIILIALGVASVIMIIIGGFKYITSSGDSNSVNSAKNTILYAIIGLIVAVFARPLITFVAGRF